jgi:hypothetical protein
LYHATSGPTNTEIMNTKEPKDPQAIGDVLKSPKSQLSWLINRARFMQEMEAVIHEILGEPLAHNVHVANYENAILTLIAPNATTATQLRYASRNLIDQLHFYPKWSRLYKIDIKVKP